MKKTFPPEARKAAIEAIERFSAGVISKDELARKAGHFKILYFEKGHNGNFNCFLALTPDGFSKEDSDISRYQNIPESDIPDGNVLFV